MGGTARVDDGDVATEEFAAISAALRLAEAGPNRVPA